MNTKTLRKIDYYLGVPLCFFINSLHNLSKILNFRKRESPFQKPKKILFIKLSEMGSIILSFPLLNEIKKRHPDAELFFLTFHKNAEVFDVLGGIIKKNNIICVREASFLTLAYDIIKALKIIRALNMDIVFDLELFSRFTAIMTQLSAGKKSVGFHRYSMEGLYRGHFFTHNIPYNPLIHISRQYLCLCEALDGPSKTTPEFESTFTVSKDALALPEYQSDDHSKTRLQEKLDKNKIKQQQIILLNPGEGALPLREWPLDYFIELCKKLLQNENTFLVLIGTEGASAKGEKILTSLATDRCVSLINQTSIHELLELFSIAKVLIINDCGLAHLSSLTNIKKFVIFGPESPKLYGPLHNDCRIFYNQLPCSPCLSAFNHRYSLCRENLCLKKISPQMIYNEIMAHLQI